MKIYSINNDKDVVPYDELLDSNRSKYGANQRSSKARKTGTNVIVIVKVFFFAALAVVALELLILLMNQTSYLYRVRQSTAASTMSRPNTRTHLCPEQRPHHSAYSSSHCIGDSLTDGAWQYRSCRLQSVCYDAVSKEFTYYANSHEDKDLSSKDLSVSLGPLSRVSHIEPWSTRVLHNTTVPDNAIWIDGISLLFEEYNAENFGHVLFDEVFPWYRLTDTFGLLDRPFRPIHSVNKNIVYSCEWRVVAGWDPDTSKCDMFYEKIGAAFAGRSVEVLQRDYNDTWRPYCFENLLVGIGYMSDHGHDPSVHGVESKLNEPELQNIGIASTFWNFRNEFMHRVGLVPITDVVNGAAFVECNVVLNSKEQTKDECATLASRLRHEFHTKQVPCNVRDDIDMKELSIKQQLELMSNTKVMVAPSGGSALVGLFLPRDATAVLLKTRGLAYDGDCRARQNS